MDEESHIKEVYAHFGLAIYGAQVLEHGIVNALIYCDLIPNKAHTVRSKEEWSKLFDAFMERNFKDSLGTMIKTLKAVIPVTPELEERFAECLRKRNWLAHHYFKDRVHLFLSEAGRDEMILQLASAHQLFEKVERELDSLLAPVRLANGITDEKLQIAYSEYISELRAQGS